MARPVKAHAASPAQLGTGPAQQAGKAASTHVESAMGDNPCVAVAFSGGTDSLALLHATAHAAAALGLQVVALHVHHGLMPQADDWARSAARLCARWRRRGLPVRLCCHRVATRPAPGDSIEAWARQQRYAALATMARQQQANLVLLAQHRRDQAETVLLQALRGAGPRGLAAMPRVIERDGLQWARPWLDRPRNDIEAYVRRHRLQPIHDPSNDDPRLTRSRLRAQVWPALLGAFADAERALSGLALRAHEAASALAELAAMDLAAITDGGALRVRPWLALSAARRGNALRAWLESESGQGASQTLVRRLLDELPSASSARWPLVGNSSLILYRGRLHCSRSQTPGAGAPRGINLSRPGRIELPDWQGAFEVRPCNERGLSLQHLASARVAARSGGERFQRDTASIARSLKKQYQAAAVPAHERHGPLLWAGDQLLFVPGLGTDARCWATAGEAQFALIWHPHPAA